MTPDIEEALRANFEWFDLVYDTLFLGGVQEAKLTRMAMDLVLIFGKMPRPVQLIHREMIVGNGFDAASSVDQRRFKDAVRETAAKLGFDEEDQKKLVDAAVKSIPKSRQSGIQRLAADIADIDLDKLISEKAPPGWEGTVKAMKKRMPAEKAFALAWSMYKKGAKPHYPAKEEIEAVNQEALDEVSPPGWAGTVKAMKDGGEIKNPYALAWYMKKRGATPHYKDQETSTKGRPVKKKRFRGESLSDTLAGALGEGKVKAQEVGPYSDPSAAHEKATKLKMKGAKSIRLDKRNGKWWISFAGSPDLSEASAPSGALDEGKEAIDELKFAMKHPEKMSEAKKKKPGCPCGNDHEECGCDECAKARAEDIDSRFEGLLSENLSLPLPLGTGGVSGVGPEYQPPAPMGPNESGGFRDVNLNDVRAMISSRPPLATKIAKMQKDAPVFERVGGFTADELVEMGEAYDKMQKGEPLGREERVYAETYAAMVVAAMRKPQATPVAQVAEHPVAEGKQPKLKLTSKERYRASASERRLHGGKTVTLFYVTPGDDGKMFTVVGYGPSPGERKTYATKVAQQAIEKYGADAHKHFDHMGRHARSEGMGSLDDAFELVLDEMNVRTSNDGVTWSELDERSGPKDAATVIHQYKLKIKGPGHAKLAAAIERGIGKASDLCKINPPLCKKNLGLPRGKMPQFPNDAVRDRFIKSLKDKGIRVTKGQMKVGQLKATQQEIQAEKVVGMVGSYLAGTFDAIKNPIVVSRDGYIVDGHHRWAALLTVSPGETMNVIRVDAPIRSLIPIVNEFPGVVQRGLTAASIKEARLRAMGAKHLGIEEGYPEPASGSLSEKLSGAVYHRELQASA